jgi:hypothetical protein
MPHKHGIEIGITTLLLRAVKSDGQQKEVAEVHLIHDPNSIFIERQCKHQQRVTEGSASAA